MEALSDVDRDVLVRFIAREVSDLDDEGLLLVASAFARNAVPRPHRGPASGCLFGLALPFLATQCPQGWG